MARYRQATLRKKIRTLGINGKLPMAQSVLALVGYTPDVLDAMLAQEVEWGTSKSERSRRLGEQKMATTTQENSVAATKLLIYNFHDSLRRVFKGNDALLTSLGVKTGTPSGSSGGSQRRETTTSDDDGRSTTTTEDADQPEPVMVTTTEATETETETSPNPENESTKSRRPSQSIASVIERWLLFLEGINSLPNELKAALARAGWDELALQGVANQVQGVIDAGIVQRQRMAEYESENTRCKTLAAECRQGYLTARGLILGGIRRHAPTRESELQDLLDL